MKFEYTFSAKFFTIFQWEPYNPDNQIIKYSSETKVKDGKIGWQKWTKRRKKQGKRKKTKRFQTDTDTC